VLDGGQVFADPLATRVVGPHLEAILADARAHPQKALLRRFIAVRHRFGEDALVRRVASGTEQVVVLGAGLDTVAYRRAAGVDGVVAGPRVFEVDHPATQGWKHTVLAEARVVVPSGVTYVPVDFETQDLSFELAAAGFDASAPAFFLWLGVVPYLTPQAVRDTLRRIAAVPGAAVVFDYANPVESLGERARSYHQRRAERVRALGEPFRTYLDTDRLAAELAALGLPVVADLGPQDIAVRYFGVRADSAGPGRSGGHVVLATAQD